MFDKTGERQRVFLQHCKNIVVFLEDINRMEETLKMTWIIENAELLKSIGISILEVVKAFADMESYSLIRHLNHQNISWTDDVENACNYIEIVTKVVKNIIEANEYTAQKKCLCCQDHVFFVPYSQQFLCTAFQTPNQNFIMKKKAYVRTAWAMTGIGASSAF